MGEQMNRKRQIKPLNSRQNTKKNGLLKRIDGLNTFNEKLEYLNKQFMLCFKRDELFILDMIDSLIVWGK